MYFVIITTLDLFKHVTHEEQTFGKSSKGLSGRIIGMISSSTSAVPTKVTDDPACFAIIMSEFRAYEHHKQVKHMSGLILTCTMFCTKLIND